ncbi:MAG: hypothetical protein AB7T31_03055 [Gemmatimonadales bacterium]
MRGPLTCRAIVVLACLVGTLAPQAVAQAHDHGAMPNGAGSWEPLSAPAAGTARAAGAWMLTVHGFTTTAYISDRGPRGDDGVFGMSMLGGHASRPVGSGRLELRATLSADAAFGRAGYPTLLQTGESADGSTPLLDRQHPHDLFTEIAAAHSFPIEEGAWLTSYVALVGEPAFGPLAFMHRASAEPVPRAPIGHHFLDGMHITHGVVTLGVTSGERLRFEASGFNGREPDSDRWDIEPPRVDSYSFRVSARVGSDWALQASVAEVTSPERLHPGIDVSRLSSSVTWNRPLRRGNWQTTVAVARARYARTVIPVAEARRTFSAPVLAHYLALAAETGVPEDSLALYFPERTQDAASIETSVRIDRIALGVRLETAAKTELFAPQDARHSQVYDVAKVEMGASVDVLSARAGTLSVGSALSAPFLPAELEATYGSRALSWYVFTTFRISATQMTR